MSGHTINTLIFYYDMNMYILLLLYRVELLWMNYTNILHLGNNSSTNIYWFNLWESNFHNQLCGKHR